tara:strand:+ start:964 stop:1338 length:375 start_codon:yes stop_codon:yes gene_type:complete
VRNGEKNINNKLSLKNEIIDILDDAKAKDINVVNLNNKSSIADDFIIATCRSTRHTNAVADDLVEKLKKIGINCPSPEGRPKCDWVIVDAGSIIIHLFRQEIRELYNLEKLWDINFENIETRLA